MKKKFIIMALTVCMVTGSTQPAMAASEGNYKTMLEQFMQKIEEYIEQYISGDKTENEEDKEESIKPVSGKAAEVISLTNSQRKNAGLSNLKENIQLSKLAQLKAEDMAKNGYFSHNSPTYGSAFDMLKTFGISYRTAGENIAKGQKTAQSVMNGWMGSSGHRANILNSSYSEIGVGYASDAKGNTFWVQIFKG